MKFTLRTSILLVIQGPRGGSSREVRDNLTGDFVSEPVNGFGYHGLDLPPSDASYVADHSDIDGETAYVVAASCGSDGEFTLLLEEGWHARPFDGEMGDALVDDDGYGIVVVDRSLYGMAVGVIMAYGAGSQNPDRTGEVLEVAGRQVTYVNRTL